MVVSFGGWGGCGGGLGGAVFTGIVEWASVGLGGREETAEEAIGRGR